MITPILETERLILRPITVDDAQHIYENWTSDTEVAKFMTWDVHTSVNETIEWLKIEQENISSNEKYGWGFLLKETGKLIGSGGIYYIEDQNAYELGYNLMKSYWRNGYAYEASVAMLEFGKTQLGVQNFFCRHAVDNIGSMKVMTKLGFKYFKDGKYSSFSGAKHFECKDYLLEV